MKKYTKFTYVEAEEFKGMLDGEVQGKLEGKLNGAVMGVTELSGGTDHTLTEKERTAFVIKAEMTEASKSLICGFEDGQIAFVLNTGSTNAFTVKNLSGDTGTSLSAGKVALVIGDTEANGTKIIVLN